MSIILIAALNVKNVIGANGSIPWTIPSDLQRFKQLTTGNTVLMGRKTFDSIGKPLPERRNMILTRGSTAGQGIERYRSIDEALNHCTRDEKIFVIGGGEIFRQMIGRADAMMLTIVENDSSGDTVFPDFSRQIGTDWKRISVVQHKGFRFEDYERISGSHTNQTSEGLS